MKHQHKFLTKEEAVSLFDIRKYDTIGSIRYDTIIVLEGDIILEEDLTSESIDNLIFNGNRKTSEELIIINGSLMIDGYLDIAEEYPCLLVLGDLHCNVLHSFDDLIHVTGDAYIKYVFNGNYNHGQITIEGTTHVPYVLNSDHSSNINPHESAVLINYYNNYKDFFEYHYYKEDLESVLVPEALSEGYLEYDDFIKIVVSGKNPILEGAKTKPELLLEELENESPSDEIITTLDLSDKRLKKLPLSIFKNTNLETLLLSNNNFEILPEEIGNLVNLKTLFLSSTKIKSLPDSIGNLKKLEYLNIQFCKNLKSLPETFGNLENLKELKISFFDLEVPDSFLDLPNLKTINLINYVGYYKDDVVNKLPEWLSKVKSLENLSFRRDNQKIAKEDVLKFIELNPHITVNY